MAKFVTKRTYYYHWSDFKAGVIAHEEVLTQEEEEEEAEEEVTFV